MNRERLSIYIWCAAAYEMIVFLWFRIREGGAPPLLLDPRGPLQWMFASVPTNESIMLSLVSAAWLIGIGFGIRVAPKLLWVYAILETCLALPTLFLLCTVLVLGSGHIGIGPQEFLLASLVLFGFSLVPVTLAFRLAIQKR